MQPLATSFRKQPTAAATDRGTQEFVLIQVGSRCFGIPLAQVRYVAPIPSGFSSAGRGAADYFVFEGEPLSYFSLWDLLGFQSVYAEYEEMQAMLPQRRQDHLDWMSALESSLRTGAAFAKARDPHQCAFGKWFYGYQPKDRRLSLLLGQFEHPHAMIHALADQLLEMQEAGQGGAALAAFDEAGKTTLATLLALFDRAQKLVVELHRQIAVIVAEGDRSCALGADKIRDIVEIPRDRIRQDHQQGIALGGRATAGLIILDDQSVVPLINWSGFHGGNGG